MEINLRGKTALVTGSTSGIGLGIAQALLEAHATVVVNGRNDARLASAIEQLKRNVPGGEVRGVVADLGSLDGTNRVIAAVSDVDILVGNVAAIGPRPFFETPDDVWEHAFQLTVMSAVRLSRHYAPAMMKRGWGRLLFNASTTGGFQSGEMAYYGATKAALLGMSRTLAEELAGTGVTVNAFLPGPTLGEGNRPGVEAAAQAAGKSVDEMMREWFDGPLPSLLKRFLTPAEVGNFVAFLASDRSSGITGAGLRVDGGIVRSLL